MTPSYTTFKTGVRSADPSQAGKIQAYTIYKTGARRANGPIIKAHRKILIGEFSWAPEEILKLNIPPM